MTTGAIREDTAWTKITLTVWTSDNGTKPRQIAGIPFPSATRGLNAPGPDEEIGLSSPAGSKNEIGAGSVGVWSGAVRPDGGWTRSALGRVTPNRPLDPQPSLQRCNHVFSVSESSLHTYTLST